MECPWQQWKEATRAKAHAAKERRKAEASATLSFLDEGKQFKKYVSSDEAFKSSEEWDIEDNERKPSIEEPVYSSVNRQQFEADSDDETITSPNKGKKEEKKESNAVVRKKRVISHEFEKRAKYRKKYGIKESYPSKNVVKKEKHETVSSLSRAKKVKKVPADEVISFPNEEGENLIFYREYIIDMVQQLSQCHMDLTTISVTGMDTDGFPHEGQLTQEIWENHLIKGPKKKWLIDAWETYTWARKERQAQLKYLEGHVPDFRINCMSFIRDLNNFDKDIRVQRRLEQTGHRFFLGPPYFREPVVVEELLDLPTQCGRLGEILSRLEQKRRGDTICATHDLSPIFESALLVAWSKTENRAILEKL